MDTGALNELPMPLSASQRLLKVGMVFQFPERHFLGHDIRSELTFGWPPNAAAFQDRILRVNWALNATGLIHLGLDTPTNELSDGYKRRLALAVQLVRGLFAPSLWIKGCQFFLHVHQQWMCRPFMVICISLNR